MKIYTLAGFHIAIEPKTSYTQAYIKDYLDPSCTRPDFSVKITREMLEHEMALRPGMPLPVYESTAIFRQICHAILKEGSAFFLHGSALEFDGGAYIFTAPSGTGKSTHVRLWCEQFPQRTRVINDDKPIIRDLDGVFYACGNPWVGKENRGGNISAPLKGLFILKRKTQNCVKRITPIEALAFLLNQTVRPQQPVLQENLLRLLEAVLKTTPVYILSCDISANAVKCAYKAITNKLEV